MVPIAQAIMLESFPPQQTRRGHGGVCAGRGRGADPRPDARRLDHGQLFLALDFLHQRAGWHRSRCCWQQWLVEDPPYIKRNAKADIDFIGFGLLAVWLATLQITLDKGQEADWFRRGLDSLVHARFPSLSFIGFICVGISRSSIRWWICACSKTAISPSALILMTSLAAILYGTTAQLPLFLQTLMGYPALQSGYAMSPRGVAAFFTTFIVGRLVGSIRMRWMLCFGFSMLAVSSFMLSDINLQVSQMQRHLAERRQRHRHQLHLCAADHDDDEPACASSKSATPAAFTISCAISAAASASRSSPRCWRAARRRTRR